MSIKLICLLVLPVLVLKKILICTAVLQWLSYMMEILLDMYPKDFVNLSTFCWTQNLWTELNALCKALHKMLLEVFGNLEEVWNCHVNIDYMGILTTKNLSDLRLEKPLQNCCKVSTFCTIFLSSPSTDVGGGLLLEYPLNCHNFLVFRGGGVN